LQNAIEILEKSQKFQALWDDAALLEAGVGRDLSTSARIENGTLDAALREILEPVNATYLILGENLILVTEKAVAKNYETVEFFSLIGENGDRPTLAEARALVEEIKVAIEPESWLRDDAASEEMTEIGKDAAFAENSKDGESEKDAEFTEGLEEGEEGEEKTVALEERVGEDAEVRKEKAAIWLDVESACLIVRQNQPNQRALRRWLAARLTDSAKEGEKKAN
jgi:hypothetical protein